MLVSIGQLPASSLALRGLSPNERSAALIVSLIADDESPSAEGRRRHASSMPLHAELFQNFAQMPRHACPHTGRQIARHFGRDRNQCVSGHLTLELV
jgi:hypothetical protein